MENKLKNLDKMMTSTVMEDIKFDRKLEMKIKEGILKQGPSKGKPRWSLGKRLLISSAAAVMMVGAFIGAVNVSPSFAEAVSKIPYLKIFFHEKDPVELVNDKLTEKGYNLNGVGVSYQTKELEVSLIGTEEYFQSVKGEVQKEVETLLAAENIDAYTVKISHMAAPNVKPQSEEELAQEKATLQLQESITAKLAEANINPLSLYVIDDMTGRKIQVEIADTETRVDELKQTINEVVAANGLEEFSIELDQVNLVKREQEDRWGSVVSKLSEDLMGKTGFKVTGIGYTVHPEPTVRVTTSVQSSETDAGEYAKELETKINDFLQTAELKAMTKGDKYIIEISGEDKKKIN
jgi:hypothetical protein